MTYIHDRAQLQQLAAQGNDSAQDILDLIDAGRALRLDIDGVSLAMSLRDERDHDEILASIEEDMLSKILPIILKMSGAWGIPQGGGFESLRWHLSIQQMLEIAITNHKRAHDGKEPMSILLSRQWKTALENATSYEYEGVTVHLTYRKGWMTTRLECVATESEAQG